MSILQKASKYRDPLTPAERKEYNESRRLAAHEKRMAELEVSYPIKKAEDERISLLKKEAIRLKKIASENRILVMEMANQSRLARIERSEKKAIAKKAPTVALFNALLAWSKTWPSDQKTGTSTDLLNEAVKSGVCQPMTPISFGRLLNNVGDLNCPEIQTAQCYIGTVRHWTIFVKK